MSYKDITGQKFGKLTAVKYIGNEKWECICDCGNTHITKGSSLRTGHTKSCGCMHIERVSETKNPDLIGKKFGKLTVVEYAGHNKFKCACDCGGTCEVNTFSLKSGHTRSCGCLERNSKDLSGQKFGRLTVLYRDVDYVLPNGAKRQTYRCACDCGEECIVLKQHLVSGNTKSCGCLSKDVSSLKGRGHVDISGQKFGKLTTVEYCGDSKWLCVCDCGNLCNVKTADLRGYNTRSCGCLIKEKALYNIKKHGEEAPNRKIRAEYERIHGKLEEGYTVMPIDGHINNLSEGNMIAINKNTRQEIYRNKLYGLGELTKTAALAFELLDKTKELEKNKT